MIGTASTRQQNMTDRRRVNDGDGEPSESVADATESHDSDGSGSATSGERSNSTTGDHSSLSEQLSRHANTADGSAPDDAGDADADAVGQDEDDERNIGQRRRLRSDWTWSTTSFCEHTFLCSRNLEMLFEFGLAASATMALPFAPPACRQSLPQMYFWLIALTAMRWVDASNYAASLWLRRRSIGWRRPVRVAVRWACIFVRVCTLLSMVSMAFVPMHYGIDLPFVFDPQQPSNASVVSSETSALPALSNGDRVLSSSSSPFPLNPLAVGSSTVTPNATASAVRPDDPRLFPCGEPLLSIMLVNYWLLLFQLCYLTIASFVLVVAACTLARWRCCSRWRPIDEALLGGNAANDDDDNNDNNDSSFGQFERDSDRLVRIMLASQYNHGVSWTTSSDDSGPPSPIRSSRALRRLTEAITFRAPPTMDGDDGDASECAICFDTFVDGDELRRLACGHHFHLRCVDPWIRQRSGSCPLCRHAIVHHRSRAAV